MNGMDFLEWWHNTGSGIVPRRGDDMEGHARRVARAAWVAACPCGAEDVEIGKNKWRAVKDGNPDQYGDYLASTPAKPRGWIVRFAPVGWICSDAYPVTHWMPLPEAPKRGESA